MDRCWRSRTSGPFRSVRKCATELGYGELCRGANCEGARNGVSKVKYTYIYIYTYLIYVCMYLQNDLFSLKTRTISAGLRGNRGIINCFSRAFFPRSSPGALAWGFLRRRVPHIAFAHKRDKKKKKKPPTSTKREFNTRYARKRGRSTCTRYETRFKWPFRARARYLFDNPPGSRGRNRFGTTQSRFALIFIRSPRRSENAQFFRAFFSQPYGRCVPEVQGFLRDR